MPGGGIFDKMRVVSGKLTKGRYQTTIEPGKAKRRKRSVLGASVVFQKTGFTWPERSKGRKGNMSGDLNKESMR